MKLTSRLLKSKGACTEQVDLFRELGGDKVPITLALVEEHASKFDWNWAARHLLSEAYWAEYEHVQRSAWAEYERVKGLAWAEYERVTGPALAEYEHVRRLAWAEYERACAKTFWQLWEKEN